MGKAKKLFISYKLIFFLLAFMFISIITIRSSMIYLPSYLGNLAFKQAIWYFVGFIFIIFILLIPDDNYKYNILFYVFNIFLLSSVLIIGTPINGSKCWLILPGIGSIQPSEFMKISLIITISKIVSHHNKSKIKGEILLFFKVLCILTPAALLTFLEPDTGAVLIYIVITISILFISPLRKRWFIFLFTLIGVLATFFLYLYFTKQDIFINMFGTDLFYRIDRLLDWKNGTGMQLENSLTAIGSAGIMGHGYMKTPIYFPESGTDFIFAVFTSNFGLIGCLLLMIGLITFDITLINLSKKANNVTDKYIIIGTVGMLVYQQIQNIGMTLGILPITGITLPFISYGGSSLLSYLIIMGIIFKIHHRTYKSIN